MQFKSTLILYHVICLAAVCAQLFIGGSFVLCLALYLISIFATVPFIKKGKWYPGDVFFIFACLYYGTLTLIVKTVVNQPVQQNIFAESDTIIYLITGFVSIFVGYLFSTITLNFKQAAFKLGSGVSDIYFLKNRTLPIFLVGCVFAILHVIFAPKVIPGTDLQTAGFGGFGSLEFLISFGVVCQTCLMILENKNQKHKIILVLMFSFTLVISVAANSKGAFIKPLLSMIMAIAFYGNLKVKLGHVLGVASGLLFVFFILSPIVHIMRSDKFELGLLDRLANAIEILQKADFDISKLKTQEEVVAAAIDFSNSPQGNYLFPSNLNADRFTLVGPIDMVARRYNSLGPLGLPVLGDIVNIIPGPFIKKEAAISPDLIAWYYGFRQKGSVARPIVGLIASAIALGGYIAVVFIPGIAMYATIVALNFIGGPLRNNVWGIFVIGSSTFMIEGCVGQLPVFFARDYLFIIVTGFLLKSAMIRGAVETQRLQRFSSSRRIRI